jgi:hypothetical protein
MGTRTTYTVENIAGGTAYRGSDLSAAMERANSWDGDGYVRSARGARPVYSGRDGLELGRYGQALDSLEGDCEDREK